MFCFVDGVVCFVLFWLAFLGAGERILVLWQGEKVSCCGLCRTGHICVFPGRLLVVESEDSGQVVGALWAVSVMVATQASWFRGVVIPFRVGCSS